MKNLLYWLGVSLLGACVIVSAIAVGTLWPKQQVRAEAVATTQVKPAKASTFKLEVEETPKTIEFPSLGKKLNVTLGQYDQVSRTWTLNDTDVFISDKQSKVSSKKHAPLAFLYGHNTPQVLGETIRLKPHDKLVVRTTHHVFTYTFSQALLVQPTETSVVTDASRGQLALLSCEGPESAERRIMYFNLEEVK